MQVAVIKHDDNTIEKITAIDFAKKTYQEISKQRKNLYCPECLTQIRVTIGHLNRKRPF
ncbi:MULTISPECIES: hypothetical protein [Cysteiniphilum]|uniref:hypothetical protein n=1 Tax=Cysteiniphilum TaxID=2056696 RepID=UPI00177C1F14|nr:MULTISPECIES: hypothetical protein [Cysteiniphilum]